MRKQLIFLSCLMVMALLSGSVFAESVSLRVAYNISRCHLGKIPGESDVIICKRITSGASQEISLELKPNHGAFSGLWDKGFQDGRTQFLARVDVFKWVEVLGGENHVTYKLIASVGPQLPKHSSLQESQISIDLGNSFHFNQPIDLKGVAVPINDGTGGWLIPYLDISPITNNRR